MTPLGQEIAALIRDEGPITVERYMALCLGHPRLGYYMTRDPFGQAGDFTTAPEISQMFGELIGLWAAETWSVMGQPAGLALVELGPGRGTLMADALRALRLVPALRDNLSVHLVETSPVLRGTQNQILSGSGVPVSWHKSLAEVPPGPAITIANEFLDALPLRQFVRAPTGWHERLIGLNGAGELAFGLAGQPVAAFADQGQLGDILEVPNAALTVTREIAERLVTSGGAALLIDYGHLRSGFGDTLQAVRQHAFTDPLAEPGEADLTVHVDFAAIGRAAAVVGARVHGPVTQGAFLQALGIEARAAALARKADPDTIAAALARLAGTAEGQMGELFKVIGLSSPGLAAVPALQQSPPEPR